MLKRTDLLELLEVLGKSEAGLVLSVEGDSTGKLRNENVRNIIIQY
jgi:hypothetical protein